MSIPSPNIKMRKVVSELWENLALGSEDAVLDRERLIAAVERCAEALEQAAEPPQLVDIPTAGFRIRVRNAMRRTGTSLLDAARRVQIEIRAEQELALREMEGIIPPFRVPAQLPTAHVTEVAPYPTGNMLVEQLAREAREEDYRRRRESEGIGNAPDQAWGPVRD